MPKLSNQVNVVVTDKGKVADKRRASIEIEADAEAFLLSDMLAKEGLLRELKAALGAAVRKAVGEYIAGGKCLLREVGKEKMAKDGERKKLEGQDKRIGAQVYQAAEATCGISAPKKS